MTQDENQGVQGTEGAAEDITQGAAAGADTDGGQGDDGGTATGSDIERLATDMGWSPEDRWRGDPDKWVDAETFIRQGPEILKTTLRTQDEKLSKLGDQIGRMSRAAENADKRAYDKAMADLKAEQREAVEEGDVEKFEAAQGKVDALAKDKPADEAKADDKKADGQPAPMDDPNYRAFAEANPWYEGDIEMGAYADQIASRVGRRAQGAEFYKVIAEEVRKKFPEHFTNTARRTKARVEGAGSGTAKRTGGAKKYADLPDDATKQACDRYVEQGLYKDKQAYVDFYFSEANQ